MPGRVVKTCGGGCFGPRPNARAPAPFNNGAARLPFSLALAPGALKTIASPEARGSSRTGRSARRANWRPFTTFWHRPTRNSFKLKLSAVEAVMGSLFHRLIGQTRWRRQPIPAERRLAGCGCTRRYRSLDFSGSGSPSISLRKGQRHVETQN
jgi:hypothetical protein